MVHSLCRLLLKMCIASVANHYIKPYLHTINGFNRNLLPKCVPINETMVLFHTNKNKLQNLKHHLSCNGDSNKKCVVLYF